MFTWSLIVQTFCLNNHYDQFIFYIQSFAFKYNFISTVGLNFTHWTPHKRCYWFFCIFQHFHIISFTIFELFWFFNELFHSLLKYVSFGPVMMVISLFAFNGLKINVPILTDLLTQSLYKVFWLYIFLIYRVTSLCWGNLVEAWNIFPKILSFDSSSFFISFLNLESGVDSIIILSSAKDMLAQNLLIRHWPFLGFFLSRLEVSLNLVDALIDFKELSTIGHTKSRYDYWLESG